MYLKEKSKEKIFLLKENKIVYIAGFIVILFLKAFYSSASSHALKWILAPTARWVELLSGISFTYETGAGYVNHSYKFIIAPSCSGVQFMIIVIATLIFSFVHRMTADADKPNKKILWTIGSIIFAYLFTILINGLRILLSIYLPNYIYGMGISAKWLTSDRLHTLTGTVVYFTALLALYRLADFLSSQLALLPQTVKPYPQTHSILNSKINNSHDRCQIQESCIEAFPNLKRSMLQAIHKCLPPVFWYFFIVLGIPFLNRAYKTNSEKFWNYAMLITPVCLMIFFLFCALTLFRNRRRRLMMH